MTREDKIKEAYKEYIKEEGILQSNPWFAFKAGAEWADTHPNFESILHDASEEPQDKDEYILYYSEYYNKWFIYYLVYLLECSYDSWSEFVEKESIKQWAYLKDILPKTK